MKLIQVVCDKSELNLTKEKKQIQYGEVFEIESEERVKEILAATFQGKPVAELIEEDEQEEVKEEKPKGKRNNSKK